MAKCKAVNYSSLEDGLEGEFAFQTLLYDLLDIRKQQNEAGFRIKYLAYQFVTAQLGIFQSYLLNLFLGHGLSQQFGLIDLHLQISEKVELLLGFRIGIKQSQGCGQPPVSFIGLNSSHQLMGLVIGVVIHLHTSQLFIQ